MSRNGNARKRERERERNTSGQLSDRELRHHVTYLSAQLA